MKNLILFAAIILVSVSSNAQSTASVAATPVYNSTTTSGKTSPCWMFIENGNTNDAWQAPVWDTVGAYVQCVKPITMYTYSVTPLYVISAPVGSICLVTGDTSVYLKLSTSDSANWYKIKALSTGTN